MGEASEGGVEMTDDILEKDLDYLGECDPAFAVLMLMSDIPQTRERIMAESIIYRDLNPCPAFREAIEYYEGSSDDIDRSLWDLAAGGIITDGSGGYHITEYGHLLRDRAVRVYEGGEQDLQLARHVRIGCFGLQDRAIVCLAYRLCGDSAINPLLHDQIMEYMTKVKVGKLTISQMDLDKVRWMLTAGHPIEWGD